MGYAPRSLPVAAGSNWFFAFLHASILIDATATPLKLRGPQPKAQSQSVAVYCGPRNRSFKQTLLGKSKHGKVESNHPMMCAVESPGLWQEPEPDQMTRPTFTSFVALSNY